MSNASVHDDVVEAVNVATTHALDSASKKRKITIWST
jgi:hypothetical protein